jgi:mRNA degradation ribonuclease J1/J2
MRCLKINDKWVALILSGNKTWEIRTRNILIRERIALGNIKFHQVHASGHMSKEELVEMVKCIQPKRAFAVHTENQKLFKSYCNNMQMIEQGKEYELK